MEEETKTCCICFCDIEDECFTCDGSDNYCSDCMESYLKSTTIMESNQLGFYEKHNAIKCMMCDFKLNDNTLLKSSLNKEYLKIVVNISNSIVAKKTEAMMMKANNESNSASQILISEIEKILTNCICCPYCKQVFYDFAGCLALTCSSCNKSFCGACLKPDRSMVDSRTCHIHVKKCIKTYDHKDQQYFKFHSSYYIEQTGWPKLQEKFKVDSILEYLNTIRFEVLWNAANDILSYLNKNKLLEINNLERLETSIFSHDANGVHLIRMPIVFWMIYSVKYDMKVEDVMKTVRFETKDRIDCGKYVIECIRRRYPKWRAIKHKVPGEDFEAVNYSPEISAHIYDAITKWGEFRRFW
tara:strand:- start:972 stop:2039 length:1068 start_codon:yes stop_codon:yes gene_type:complete